MSELIKKQNIASAEDSASSNLTVYPTPAFKAPALSGMDTLHTKFPDNLPHKLPLVRSQHGVIYAVIMGKGNPYVLRVGSKQLDNLIRTLAHADGVTLSNHELKKINEALIAQVEMSDQTRPVWSRVAPIQGGIEIDLCDAQNTRLRVTAGKVEILREGSDVLFYRNPVCLPMVMPAPEGNLNLLKNYVNLSESDFVLFTAWLSYTLAHPKVSTSNYVILVLQGDQGTGKSFVCRYVIINLIDPSRVGVQVFPGNAKDLTIAAQHAHVLCYDNLRGFKPYMADLLCMASTGGAISTRALYSDAEQFIHDLHVPLVLNGIHRFINQPDLAQRCLCIETKALPEAKRKSEADMVKALEADLPVIFRGLLDLIAGVFKHLPDAEITNPERMLDFVRWLAAMEKVHRIPSGIYQAQYSHVLQVAQLDTLMDNLLAAAIIEFSASRLMKSGKWTGTPADLLRTLEMMITDGTKYSAAWPKNPIALSRRLTSLKAGLLSQGISVEFARGKQRTITIKTVGDHDESF